MLTGGIKRELTLWRKGRVRGGGERETGSGTWRAASIHSREAIVSASISRQSVCFKGGELDCRLAPVFVGVLHSSRTTVASLALSYSHCNQSSGESHPIRVENDSHPTPPHPPHPPLPLPLPPPPRPPLHHPHTTPPPSLSLPVVTGVAQDSLGCCITSSVKTY